MSSIPRNRGPGQPVLPLILEPLLREVSHRINEDVLRVLNSSDYPYERMHTQWVSLLAYEFLKLGVSESRVSQVLEYWVQAPLVRRRVREVVSKVHNEIKRLEAAAGDNLVDDKLVNDLSKCSGNAQLLYRHFKKSHGYREFKMGYAEMVAATKIKKPTLARVVRELDANGFIERVVGSYVSPANGVAGTNEVTTYKVLTPDERYYKLGVSDA